MFCRDIQSFTCKYFSRSMHRLPSGHFQSFPWSVNKLSMPLMFSRDIQSFLQPVNLCPMSSRDVQSYQRQHNIQSMPLMFSRDVQSFHRKHISCSMHLMSSWDV